ncbi:MAG: CoA transferase [Acidimicrobiales bacterium]|nr:CoA transferase [Hyphomonadaceae bacterium]RZV43042.1 MAG: CoA transferase [Acidimicrobiales bacterium]
MSILSGVKIIEIEGIGPGPFCGMLLADLGADVVVIERPGTAQFASSGETTITKRGKNSISLNLKNEDDKKLFFKLIEKSDGLIEGMRPGVMEKLGLGPEICHKINPRLAYGRVTGWGQDGPLSHAAGHDLNYIGLSGALWYSGRPGDPPFAPPSLVGDVAGGALYLAIGMLATIMKARESGNGDVVDAAMIDGSAHMMNLLLTAKQFGALQNERGKSILDGPHWYDSYSCKDGGFITIGSLEPKFYALLIEKLELTNDASFANQMDASVWPEQKEKLATIFKSRTRDEWCELMEGTDICFAPVLNPDEAAEHPHMKSRKTYSSERGSLEAMPAPRFSNHANRAPSNSHPTTVADLLQKWK